ncbi:MAG: SLC13 family permease [Planctomycetales bacterium]|nr:SLC13 family permease [Planctomycetales bacterium]
MSLDVALVLGMLLLASVLFATEALSVDLVTLLLLVVLVGSGILTPAEAFAGFASEIVVVLASIFVVSGALQRSGFMDALGARLGALARGGPTRLLLFVTGLVSAVSAFMNNTTATAVLVNPVIGAARRAGVSPSRVLMPLAYASILGGTLTLIGTSTNVAVSGYLERAGFRAIGLFEISPVGVVLVLCGLAYLALLGHRLLPARPAEEPADDFQLREYLSEIVVGKGSPLVGQRIFESDLARMNFRVLRVQRGDETHLPDSRSRIAAEDVLVVEGPTRDLLTAQAKAGIRVRAEKRVSTRVLQSGAVRVAEVLVTPRSELQGLTLREADFRERYGITVLAVNHHGRAVHENLADLRLHVGDLLLVQGPADRIAFLRRHRDLWVLEEVEGALPGAGRGALTAAFFAGAVVVGGLGWLPLSVSFLAAAVLAALTRACTVEEAYKSVDWRLIVLIAGMTAFGTALEKTGGAKFLADQVVGLLEPGGPLLVLAGFMVVTTILTQPMSNAAAALVVLPVGMAAARDLGADPRSFAIGVMLAASVSLVTPFEPSCLLVYGPGRYRFSDFVRVGGPLTVLLLLVLVALVPRFWPLMPG